MLIISDKKDPIYVTPGSSPRYISLRIGKRRQGQTRYAMVTTSEARFLAYRLLAQAEFQEEEMRDLDNQTTQPEARNTVRMTNQK